MSHGSGGSIGALIAIPVLPALAIAGMGLQAYVNAEGTLKKQAELNAETERYRKYVDDVRKTNSVAINNYEATLDKRIEELERILLRSGVVLPKNTNKYVYFLTLSEMSAQLNSNVSVGDIRINLPSIQKSFEAALENIKLQKNTTIDIKNLSDKLIDYIVEYLDINWGLSHSLKKAIEKLNEIASSQALNPIEKVAGIKAIEKEVKLLLEQNEREYIKSKSHYEQYLQITSEIKVIAETLKKSIILKKFSCESFETDILALQRIKEELLCDLNNAIEQTGSLEFDKKRLEINKEIQKMLEETGEAELIESYLNEAQSLLSYYAYGDSILRVSMSKNGQVFFDMFKNSEIESNDAIAKDVADFCEKRKAIVDRLSKTQNYEERYLAQDNTDISEISIKEIVSDSDETSAKKKYNDAINRRKQKQSKRYIN